VARLRAIKELTRPLLDFAQAAFLRLVPHQCRMQTRSRNLRFRRYARVDANIPQQVIIWLEAEAFFDSISDADTALRIVAAT
jgi:hypothetical protein